MSSTLERQARTVGGNRKLLRSRLLSARAALTDDFKQYFTPGRLQYDQKRLVSECGIMALQWSIRDYPKSPITYENQQTSLGSVKLVPL